MKKIYTLIGLTLLAFQSEKSFSQSSLLFYASDTIVYGAPVAFGDIEIHGSYIRNNTANTLTVDVVRVQDVDIAGSGWISYFCTDGQCYADVVDSIRFTIAVGDSTDFIPHFNTTATPDSQTVYFKVQNANNPTDAAYHRFYGVTKIGSGIYESSANLAKVNIYPSPAIAGNDFDINIENVKNKSNPITLLVYTIYGSIVSTVIDLQEGPNTLNLDLSAGMYSYNLISGDVIINAGKFSIVKQ